MIVKNYNFYLKDYTISKYAKNFEFIEEPGVEAYDTKVVLK